MQVGKGKLGYLRDYASKLAKEVGCGRYEVYPLFDKAIHWTIGDVISFLEGEESRNHFELVWNRISELFQNPTLFPGYSLLLTSDHGYDVFENESGVLCVGHGGGEKATLQLDNVSLFATISPRSRV